VEHAKTWNPHHVLPGHPTVISSDHLHTFYAPSTTIHAERLPGLVQRANWQRLHYRARHGEIHLGSYAYHESNEADLAHSDHLHGMLRGIVGRSHRVRNDVCTKYQDEDGGQTLKTLPQQPSDEGVHDYATQYDSFRSHQRRCEEVLQYRDQADFWWR
jgi:hypothetical protein